MTPASNHPVVRFQRMFEGVTPDMDLDLAPLYHEDVDFVDPFHRLQGRRELQKYFTRFSKRLVWGEFSFEAPIITENAAALPWTMHFRGKGYPRVIAVEGISHLQFDDRISYHRDYFDVSALMGDAIPGAGGLFRLLRRVA